MSRTFSALDILNRAAEYGIVVESRGNTLSLDVPPTLASVKRNRAVAVIRENEATILGYLGELYQEPALCATCLDGGQETRASHEHKGLMYCDGHRPGRKKREQKAKVSAGVQQSLFV